MIIIIMNEVFEINHIIGWLIYIVYYIFIFWIMYFKSIASDDIIDKHLVACDDSYSLVSY